jgi:ethanolamine utilization protein EutQ (cupin superfamily)
MVRKISRDQRDLQPFEVPGATVRVSDPVVGSDNNLAAGFTEYTATSRLEWTFDYDEVFYILEGALEIHIEGQDPMEFGGGDLGYIEKGTSTTIVVPERAYLLHFTQPAWRE